MMNVESFKVEKVEEKTTGLMVVSTGRVLNLVTIELTCDDIAQAAALLGFLTSGGVEALATAEPLAPFETPPAPAAVEAPKTRAKRAAKLDAEPPPASAAEAQEPIKAEPAPVPEPEVKAEPAKPEPAKAATKEEAPPRSEADSNEAWGIGPEHGGPPEEMVKASKFRDIIVYLQSKGFKTEQQVIDVCEKMRDQVPILVKMEDLPGRVKRAFEVMQYTT
jgi:hypothetical protein